MLRFSFWVPHDKFSGLLFEGSSSKCIAMGFSGGGGPWKASHTNRATLKHFFRPVMYINFLLGTPALPVADFCSTPHLGLGL